MSNLCTHVCRWRSMRALPMQFDVSFAECTVTNPCPGLPGSAATTTAAGWHGTAAAERWRPDQRHRHPTEETHPSAARPTSHLTKTTTALQHSYLGDRQTKDVERGRARDGTRRKTHGYSSRCLPGTRQ